MEWVEEFRKLNPTNADHNAECSEALAWLEKQGEQKPAWSEEDEMFVHGLIRGLEAKRDIHGHTTFSSDCIDITETIDWLKSLKDRYTWKPSEGQLECLGYAIEKAEKDWSPLTNNRIYLTLKALKEHFQKIARHFAEWQKKKNLKEKEE